MFLVLNFGVEVVEEDAAYAAGFLAVRDPEVGVAPGFEAWVVGTVVFVAGFFDVFVEVDGVFVEEVGGGEVCAAAEPPCGLVARGGVHGFEVAVVEVYGRGHGVVGMEDEGETGGEEFERGDVWVEGFVVDTHFGDGRAGEGAIDDGGVDAGFFEDGAVLEDAGCAASAVGAGPGIGAEFVDGGWVDVF